MIDVQSNAAEFMAQLDAAIADIDRQLDSAFFNWTIRIFHDQVVLYPQWSGDAASNWVYSVGSPSGQYNRYFAKDLRWGSKGFASEPPVQRGDFEAVSVAMTRALDGPRPSWQDKVYFTNNTPIATELDNPPPAWVRPINLVGGAVATELDNPPPAWVRPISLVGGAVATAQFIADTWRNLPYDATQYTFP